MQFIFFIGHVVGFVEALYGLNIVLLCEIAKSKIGFGFIEVGIDL